MSVCRWWSAFSLALRLAILTHPEGAFRRLSLTACILMLTFLPIMADSWADSIPAELVEVDSLPAAPQKRPNIIRRIIGYFEKSNKEVITRRPKFTFIGGPYYSNDTKFGIGLLAAGLYSTEPADTTLKPSNIDIFANITTGKYFKLGVDGIHSYRRDSRRVEYELSFKSYSTYYWGIGARNGLDKQNKTGYHLLNIMLSGNHLWHVWRNLYAGPILRLEYTAARSLKNPDMWTGQPLTTLLLEAGATIGYDDRNNFSFPTRGTRAEVSASYNQGLLKGYHEGFASLTFSVSKYFSVWKSGVVAAKLHGIFTFGDTPWCFMPSVGKSDAMRGYYEGQYRDKQEMDLMVELRQHVYRRSGIVVFAGVGSVFPSLIKIRSRDLLPSYGIGYRWEFKQRTNIRVDIGFGRKCWGIEFNIGESF